MKDLHFADDGDDFELELEEEKPKPRKPTKQELKEEEEAMGTDDEPMPSRTAIAQIYARGKARRRARDKTR